MSVTDSGVLETESTGATESTAQETATESDKGFPANTAVADMTDKEQAAYYKQQARKHEDRVKAIGLTPEQLQDLRTKATKHDELERELMSDRDKAIAEARDATRTQVLDELRPRLVEAELRAAAAGRVESERLQALIGPLDKKWFLSDNGEIDAAKVSSYVDSIAATPVTGSQQPQQVRPGPSAAGLGSRSSSATPSVESGRELYRAKYRKGS